MADRKTNRREFLRGKSVRVVLENFAAGAPREFAGEQPAVGGAPGTTSQAASYLVQIGRRAMATDFEVLLNAGQHPGGPESAMAVLDLVDQLEDQLTVYRDHSEVSRLNRAAFAGPVQVESGLFELLETAARIHRDTAGAFDITAGPLIRLWGFHRRQGQLPDETEIAATLRRVGGQSIELDAANGTVRFTVDGLEINLGSIGKGYALDRCAALLAADGIDDFLFHGGQSSILARGNRTAGERPGWQIHVRHPLLPDRHIARLWLRDQALATSGSANQFFHHQGRRFGHILDPRTGWPPEDLLSTTVLAPTATEADALATAFFVMGLDATWDYCQAHPEVAALLVRGRPGSPAVQLHTVGLDDSQVE